MQLKRHLTVLALALSSAGAFAQLVVGVSYDAFQEERWKTRPSASGHSSYIEIYQGRNSRLPMQDVRGMPASAGSCRTECGLHKVHLAKVVCQELGLWHCDKAYARRPDLQPCL